MQRGSGHAVCQYVADWQALALGPDRLLPETHSTRNVAVDETLETLCALPRHDNGHGHTGIILHT